MTFSDALSIMPIIITACAALLVLLSGHFLPARATSAIAVVGSTAAGAWAAFAPVANAPALPGLTFGPLGRFLIPVFCIAAALTLLFSHSYNERRAIKGEEYPATVLFALFAMCVLPCATNLLILFLALE